MNYYRLSLTDIKTLADALAQLDHAKNLIPEGCNAIGECAVLVDQGHSILARALGADDALVYATETESKEIPA